jgi:hypothetical protein
MVFRPTFVAQSQYIHILLFIAGVSQVFFQETDCLGGGVCVKILG